MTEPAILVATGLRKHYGAVRALDGVDFTLRRGELCGLIGPNGSGKSTFFDCITGLIRPDHGAVQVAGRDVTSWPMHRRSLEARMQRSFQRNTVFSRMSVTENLVIAGQQHRFGGVLATFLNGPRTWRTIADLHRRAGETLDLVKLSHLAKAPAGSLSVGQQKLLQFAALLMAEPRIILLDEPLAGVNPLLIETIAESIAHANRELNVTTVLIEHNIGVVMGLCRRVVVMTGGKVIADDVPETVAQMPQVREAYLGA